MKKFYKKLFLFLVLTGISMACMDVLSMVEPFRTQLAYLTDSYAFISVNTGADEIKPYIEKAQTDDKTTKLIFGDSVCHQMFRRLQKYNEDISMIGSNGAITLAGQYILAEEYLKSHPYATDLYLILLPESLTRTFDTGYGYQYAVMPFVETDTLQLLDENTIACMEQVYGKLFLKPAVVKAIDKSAVNRKLYLNILRECTDGYQPEMPFEIAEQYLMKMDRLCEEHQVRLHLLPGPVCESKAEYMKTLEQIWQSGPLSARFPDFFSSISYYSADQAKDGTHFSGAYARQKSMNKKIKKMISGTELADQLRYQ